MDLYRQRSYKKKSSKALIFSISICLLFLLEIIGTYGTHVSQCCASVSFSSEVSFSLDIESLPLKKACDIILNKTDYKLIFDPKWQDKAITLKFDDVPLYEGIRRIIKIAGITNYALVQNSNEIKILSFDNISSDGERTIEELNADSMQDTSTTDVGISLTLADMQALKQKAEENKNNTPKDMIVTPPSSSGRGMTVEELEALKQANKELMKNRPKNTVVTPPSNSGAGLTLGELEAIKQNNKLDIEQRPKDMIVTPPSASGTGLTIEELEALQKKNQVKSSP